MKGIKFSGQYFDQNLQQSKRFSAWRLTKEFPDKSWKE